MDRKRGQTLRSMSVRVKELEEALASVRMSRDVFDQLGQMAVEINIQLEVAESLQECDPNRARQSLKEARSLATLLLQDIRRVFASTSKQGLLA